MYQKSCQSCCLIKGCRGLQTSHCAICEIGDHYRKDKVYGWCNLGPDLDKLINFSQLLLYQIRNVHETAQHCHQYDKSSYMLNSLLLNCFLYLRIKMIPNIQDDIHIFFSQSCFIVRIFVITVLGCISPLTRLASHPIHTRYLCES